MLQTIKELAQFYSQKFHLPVVLATEEWQIKQWKQDGILIGLPEDGGNTRQIENLKVVYHPAFGESVEGEVIKVGDKPVAKVGKQSLVLLFYPRNRPAESLARKLIDQALPRMARFVRQRQLNNFMDSMKDIAENVCSEKEYSIQSDQGEIEQLARQINELSRKVEADRLMLRFFKKSDEQLRKRFIKAFAELKKLVPGLYSNFKFTSRSVIGITHPFTIYHEDYTYHFHPYEVEVYFRDGDISITGDENEVDGHIHPHISGETVCWGNIGNLIPRLTGELNLHGLFQLIHQFLTTYNENDPYQRIERWNPDWYDEDNYNDEPYCSFCDDYGHDIEDCEACWYCEYCGEWVDHPRDECPKQKENLDEAA